MNELKIKIADNIIILNKYIMLILSEKRENPVNLKYLFERKVFLTKLFSKSDRPCGSAKITDSAGNEEIKYKSKLSDKLSNIAESDKNIINILNVMKEDVGDKIVMLKKISSAVKAYKSN